MPESFSADSHWIAEHARNRPDAIAMIDADERRTFTYEQLEALVELLAADLRAGGVSGGRVGVLARNRVETFALLFACRRLGATLVPLNWRLADAELAAIVERARLSALIVEGEPRFEGDFARFAFGDTGLRCITRAQRAHEPSDPALILFTSGTTGRPKGAMLGWRQLEVNAWNTTAAWDLRPTDRCLVSLPLFHTGGLNCLATPMLHRGGAVVLTRRFDAERVLELLVEARITHTIAVPTMYAMLDEHGLSSVRLPAMRTLLCGGAPCPHELIDRFHQAGLPFRQGYGLTEAGPNLFDSSPLEGPGRVGTVGRPAPHGEIRLGDDGQILVRGDHVMLGYFEDPEATRGAIDEEGYLHTGDLAERDEHGLFRVVGRSKEMFISGGENVYPAEVELVVGSHPMVREVAVVGVPDARWGQVGLAVVSLRGPLDAESLKAWSKVRLAGYKAPKHVRILDELPKNATGKVMKHTLGMAT